MSITVNKCLTLNGQSSTIIYSTWIGISTRKSFVYLVKNYSILSYSYFINLCKCTLFILVQKVQYNIDVKKKYCHLQCTVLTYTHAMLLQFMNYWKFSVFPFFIFNFNRFIINLMLHQIFLYFNKVILPAG